jgi:hypothetical protein
LVHRILFFFLGWFTREATEGGRISPPGRWGGSRPPPVAGSFFFFFFFSPEKSPEMGGEWRWMAAFVAGGGLFIWWFDLLIGCIDFIFSLCIFLKLLSCQLMNGWQKSSPFCHDRIVAALFFITPLSHSFFFFFFFLLFFFSSLILCSSVHVHAS